VLGVPAISRLFYFIPPSPIILLAGLGAVFISLMWFEGVKWALVRHQRAEFSASAGTAIL